MSVSHLLEDFGALTRGDMVEMTDVLLEEQRLEAFEKGYQPTTSTPESWVWNGSTLLEQNLVSALKRLYPRNQHLQPTRKTSEYIYLTNVLVQRCDHH